MSAFFTKDYIRSAHKNFYKTLFEALIRYKVSDKHLILTNVVLLIWIDINLFLKIYLN